MLLDERKYLYVEYIKKKMLHMKCTLNRTERDSERGGGGIIDPAFVCVTCLLLAADIFPPRATRPMHPREAELSRDGFRGGRKEWQRKGAREGGGGEEG